MLGKVYGYPRVFLFAVRTDADVLRLLHLETGSGRVNEPATEDCLSLARVNLHAPVRSRPIHRDAGIRYGESRTDTLMEDALIAPTFDVENVQQLLREPLVCRLVCEHVFANRTHLVRYD